MSDDEEARAFDNLVSALLPERRSTNSPEITLVIGQPGAGKSRAAARLHTSQREAVTLGIDDLAPFHPRFLELTRWKSIDAPAAMAPTLADWMSRGIDRILEARQSLILEASLNSPGAAFGLTADFADAGYSTRVIVVAARRSESLLSATSRYLHARRLNEPARFTDRDTHHRGWQGALGTAREAREATSVDRLTILARDGRPLFDAHRGEGFAGASSAFEAAQSVPFTLLTGAAWFGELRRMTEFARARRELSPPVAELLVELHELALNEVLPLMPLRRRSSAAVEQETRLSAELVSLRREFAIEPSYREPLAPVIAPTPVRRGPSL